MTERLTARGFTCSLTKESDVAAKSAKKTEGTTIMLDLRVTGEVSAYLDKVAKLAETTPGTVAAVILAIEIDRIKRKEAVKT